MAFPFLLPQLLDNTAQRVPERQALGFGGQRITYEELAWRSDRLARTLYEQGVKKGDRVGIYLDKSIEAIVAIYGIMKTGAAYVPIDPLAPASRVRFIIDDCAIEHLISSDTRIDHLSRAIELNTTLKSVVGVRAAGLCSRAITWEEVYQPSQTLKARPGASELDLAYVLYTSGSTGEPKGVMHTHRSALSFVQWATTELSLGAADRVSNHAPYHFDLTILDLFAACAAGAATIIIPEDVARMPASLAALIADEKLTVWYSVPFALIQLLQRGGLGTRDLKSLRCVAFAGEPFPPKHLRQLMKLLPWASFFNLYGPTETNVCTYYRVESLPEDDDRPLPIGYACSNTELLVVDKEDREVSPGEPGELLVRGGSTMPGYWNRPQKTSQAFFVRELTPPFQETFYRTGDLVQLGTNGGYQFLGRKDRQVKIRGFRIELDEIEIALLGHDQVEEAAVYVLSDSGGSSRIEAAVVPKPGANLNARRLSGYLLERLPAQAVPARIVCLDAFPRTSTGKIDRRALQNCAVPA